MSQTFKHNLSSHVRIGFNKRTDTYSGLLGYVTWAEMNKNGTMKYGSEYSLERWRDKTIDVMEIENVPRSGFVLNQKVGGTRYSWNPRLVKARVYDPLGFEFEISMDNLLFILENCYTTPGKALEGEFVYTFMDGSVFLMPTNSIEYSELVSNKEATKLGKKDLENLEFGDLVITSKGEYLYIGEHTTLKEDKSGRNFITYTVNKKEKLFVKSTDNKCIVQKTPKDIIRIIKNSNRFQEIINNKYKYYTFYFDNYKTMESLEYAILNNIKVYGVCPIYKKSVSEYYIEYKYSSVKDKSKVYSFISFLTEINK